jgi:hypothetical protein
MHSTIAVMVGGIVYSPSGKPAVRGVRTDRHLDQIRQEMIAGAIIIPM